VTALVVLAVVAGAAVAGVGLATRGTTHAARVVVVDETTGRIGSVVLGETRENVVGALGRPGEGSSAGTLRYAHLVVTLDRGLVTSVRTDDAAAQTRKALRIGDPLSAVRASYRKAAACNPNSPDKQVAHPSCTVTVPAGRMLITGDPVATIALARR
jgi:hypothetical protein